MIFEEFLHVLVHSLEDSALVLPFLFATYVLIEYVQRKSAVFKNTNFLGGTHAPLLGGIVGAFPQCGFSVMAAKLYDSKIIKMGTLLTVFIATSDEAFALLLTSAKFLDLLLLISFKIIYAVILGYLVNAFLKKAVPVKYKGGQTKFKHEEYCRQCGNSSTATGKAQIYLLYPFLHALKTFLFVLSINFIFGLFVHFVGEENISLFMQQHLFVQPFVCAIVGLIPNCASSILVTQLYISGGITFGSMFAGLCSNAGIGLAVVLKNKKNIKSNVVLVLILYLSSVLAGVIFNLF